MPSFRRAPKEVPLGGMPESRAFKFRDPGVRRGDESDRHRQRLELLRQLESLRLVVRTDVHAIQRFGFAEQTLINQTADVLAVFDHEGHIVRTHFEHGARALEIVRALTEAGIKETGVVDTEFTDRRIVGHHRRGEVVGDAHTLARHQDVKVIRVQHQ